MAKKNLTITLYKSELLYDIRNLTYLTGRSRQNGNNHEEVANMQASEDEEDNNQILRSIGNALDSLKTKLSEYYSVESVTTSNDELLDSTGDITIKLTMPSNYNSATSDSITSACHQYIVNIATADWFNITNKADAGDYVAKATANLEMIREAANKRVRPTRTVVSSS